MIRLAKEPHGETLGYKDMKWLVPAMKRDILEALQKDGAREAVRKRVDTRVLSAFVREWIRQFNGGCPGASGSGGSV